MVLDLPLCRFRQLRDVVADRRERERVADLRVREIELRWQCAFMSRSEKASEAVASIRLLPDSVPRRTAPAEPAEGSYERLMGGFGG